MRLEDTLEKYKDNRIVKRNPDDPRVYLQFVLEDDPVFFKAVAADRFKDIEDFLVPNRVFAEKFGISESNAHDRLFMQFIRMKKAKRLYQMSIELPDDLKYKIISDGCRKTSELVEYLLYGACFDTLSEEDYDMLCNIICRIGDYDKSKFAPYVSTQDYEEAGSVRNAIRKIKGEEIPEKKPRHLRVSQIIPKELWHKLVDNGYRANDHVVRGICEGLKVKNITRRQYEDLIDAMVKYFDVDRRLVAPYFTEEDYEEIYEERRDVYMNNCDANPYSDMGEIDYTYGNYVMLNDFRIENKNNTVVWNHPSDARVWLQATKENAPKIWNNLVSVYSFLENVDDTFLVTWKKLKELTGLGKSQFKECRNTLINMLKEF